MPFAPVTPPQIIRRAIMAQEAFHRGSATFELSSRFERKATHLKGSVTYLRGSTLTAELRDLESGQLSDRVFKVQGNQVVGYDAYSDEVVHLPAPAGKPLSSRLAYALGTLPDPLRVVGDPSFVRSFLNYIPAIDRFNVTRLKSGYRLSFRKPRGDNRTRLDFNGRGLLCGVHTARDGAFFSWDIAYSDAYRPLQIPSGGAQVHAFSKHGPPPRYADAASRAECLRALRAMRSLKPCKIFVTRPARNSVVCYDSGRIKENNGGKTWAYDGALLTVNSGARFYRGKASRADALDYLAALTNGEDTLARSFLLKSNLIDSFLGSHDVVRIAGRMKVAGEASTIIQVSGPGVRSSLIVRNSDHLLISSSTDTLDRNGKVAFHDECNYRYQRLSPSPSVFRLAPLASARVLPLPKNALHPINRYTQVETVPVPGGRSGRRL